MNVWKKGAEARLPVTNVTEILHWYATTPQSCTMYRERGGALAMITSTRLWGRAWSHYLPVSCRTSLQLENALFTV